VRARGVVGGRDGMPDGSERGEVCWRSSILSVLSCSSTVQVGCLTHKKDRSELELSTAEMKSQTMLIIVQAGS
jgi:hypothetical protein